MIILQLQSLECLTASTKDTVPTAPQNLVRLQIMLPVHHQQPVTLKEKEPWFVFDAYGLAEEAF